MATKDPSKQSGDREAMQPYLKMIAAIMGGLKTVREAGQEYLPKFEAETEKSYRWRLKNARLTNIFADIIKDLSMRPFETPVQLSEDTTQQLKDFAEDVDERGNDLTTFAEMLFEFALQDGIVWVLVDYTKGVGEGATMAEEREVGARPFWAYYRAADVLAVYTERVAGMERVVQARLREVSVERDGFEEKTVERVRVFRHEGTARPEWELWRKTEKKTSAGQNAGPDEWAIEEGPYTLDIDVIPLVPIIFGDRRGTGWFVDPPLRDAAYLQIELYQQENALKNIRTYTAFPMLAANGMSVPLDEDGKPKEMVTGPNAVLWSNQGIAGSAAGSWAYVEPTGESLKFLREDIKDTIKELRELGRQPLTAYSGNLTVITTAVAAKKGNSAIQAWAGMLKNGLLNCFEMTAMWLTMAEYKADVMVHDDIDLGIGDDSTFKDVLEMAKEPEPFISREALIDEAKRRGVLSSTYDAEKDLERLEQDLKRGEPDDPPQSPPGSPMPPGFMPGQQPPEPGNENE